MPKQDEHSSSTAKDSPSGSPNRPSLTSRLEQFEKSQRELWRLTFFLLLSISIGFAIVSWSTVRSFAQRLEPLIPGLVVIVVLFIAYAWKRNREISELRGLVRGLEQRDSAPPSEKQIDQLFSVISRSQQGYRDLIDSFDDILIALSSRVKSGPSTGVLRISSAPLSSRSSDALSRISLKRAAARAAN